MVDVVIIGGGNVAEGLAREILAAEDLRLIQRWTRKTHCPNQLTQEADVYILAVSDGAICEVAAQLPFPENSVVAHTAGCVPIDALPSAAKHQAVLYPLQSFTRGRLIPDFRRTPFFVEGSTPHALETIKKVAAALSDNITEMNSDQRAKLHLAATFANNFSNAMLSLAKILAADAEVPFQTLKPLIAETFAKAAEFESPKEAQTGPAARGDKTTQEKHKKILRATHPELEELYKNISQTIWKISKKN
jgi:predicted short-subunit dehydrogenase-like oxidoreductase (DUF2520 family)